MKILWLVNVPLPEASLLMKINPVSSGGWLSAANYLSNKADLTLSVSFPLPGIDDITILNGEKITYHAFPSASRRRISTYLETIINIVQPQVVHIFGTEYAHTLAMVKLCEAKGIKHVISIQGLVSVISRHYVSNLPIKVQKRFTFRDLVRQDNILAQQRKFLRRGKSEKEAIQSTKHIIGRTVWDRACAAQINPATSYYLCNEILREEFYKYSWSLEGCQEFSIFTSQGHYPVKGLHFLLAALAAIKRDYPQTMLYVAGPNIIKSKLLVDKLRLSSFAKYILRLIKRYNLEKNVVFTGVLNEKQMCERYLKSHVYVSASTIENESNSLSEARLLGVPVVASYVGGVVDRIRHGIDGFLYQHDAPYMLAYYVCQLFGDRELTVTLAENARMSAQRVNNRGENTEKLAEIYRDIISGEGE